MDPNKGNFYIMENRMDILTFLSKADSCPVIDVRTPSEFRQGHIPGAHNIPLFSDEERKLIGTTYKKKGKKEAVLEGLEYTGPKMKQLFLEAEKITARAGKKNKEVLVHCWRGGMRSSSMAWLFRTGGLEPHILEGGYKSFRRLVLSDLETERLFLVVGGYTGSGKTIILKQLEELGEQVIDLEAYANHKGSAFGALGENPQCSNEHFENEIFSKVSQLEKNKLIWIEDESRTIGRNTLPAGIYRNIRNSRVVFLDIPFEQRVEQLVKQYACYPEAELREAISRISPRLGDLNARTAMDAISSGDFKTAVSIALRYYDKTYSFGLGKRKEEQVLRLNLPDSVSVREQAIHLLEFVRQKRIFV